MSNNTNDLLLEDVKEVEKRSPIQRYIEYPLSFALSKLTTLFQTAQTPSQPHAIENDRSEQYELFHPSKQLYTHFTDRADPSLYYAIFSPYKRY